MLALGPTGMRSVVDGVSRADVEATFPGWEMLWVELAETAGLGVAARQDSAAVIPAPPAGTARPATPKGA